MDMHDMGGMGGMDMAGMGLFKTTDMSIARSFWYVVAGIVAFKILDRVFDHSRTILAKRKGLDRSSVPSRPSNFLTQAYETGATICRELTYPQFRPFKGHLTRHFSLPPLGNCLILAAYWVMILTMLWTNAILTKSSSMYGYKWEKVGFRAAWVTVTQLPLIYCLAGKFSIISVLTGVSYERLNWLHRWVARTMFLTAIVHWSYFFTEWSIADIVKLELDMMSMVKYGFGAWAVLGWSVLTSFGFMRNLAYELWVIQHLASAGVLLWLLYVHVPSYARYNIWMSIGFIAFDRAARSLWMIAHNVKWPTLRSQKTLATPWLGFDAEVSEPCRGYLHVRIHNVNFSWNAGQHILISLPACGFWESHPFTISTKPPSAKTEKNASQSLDLYIKCHSGFTKRLQSKVNKAGTLHTRALVSKPFGSAPLATIERCNSLILIASSTGAAFTLPLLEHAITSHSFVQRIQLYWIVRHDEQLDWFHDRLITAQQAAKEAQIAFGGQLYVTGKNSKLAHVARDSSSSSSRTEVEKASLADELLNASSVDLAVVPGNEKTHAFEISRDLSSGSTSATEPSAKPTLRSARAETMSGTPSLRPEEIALAVSQVAQLLRPANVRFSFSGGAAATLIRMQYGLTLRSTDDIDLVIQPTSTFSAESISAWLIKHYPNEFVVKTVYGVSSPALVFKKSDGGITHIEVEIFDVNAWPQRPQYNLDDPENEVITVDVSGVQVPVFGPRWQLREKIVTAFERQGNRKSDTDLEDASNLLMVVGQNSVNLVGHEDAVRHFLLKRPEIRQRLELKVNCPEVLGSPWTWDGSAGVYWRSEGEKLRYLDQKLHQHEFEWDEKKSVYYLTVGGRSWYYDTNTGGLVPHGGV
ncbi:hypothetical protein DV738_g3305, partial [Chaetothyriales sp. CBS 135597]